VEVRTYRDGDAPRVLELLLAAFGAWPGARVLAHDRPAEFFHWKHETNPHGASFILLAEEEGRLIAMRAYMHWPLLAGGVPTGAVQAVDLATHPDFRGKGVTSQLSRQAIATLRETKRFAFGLPNEMSRSQSRKVGWRPVGRLPVWVRVCRPLNIVRGARSMRGAPTGRPRAVDAPPADSVLARAEWIGELLRAAHPGGDRFSTDADLAYLRWRYQPFLADYRAVAHDEAGLAIFRLSQRGRLNEATVCELITRPGDNRAAAGLLRAVARAAPFDYLAAGAPLVRGRLVRSPIGGRMLGVTPYHAEIEPDPAQRRSWALSLGDLERLELC
jgi:GNAT superfamily N-acetyltransferase